MTTRNSSRNESAAGEISPISPVGWRWIFILEIVALVGVSASVLITDVNRIHDRRTGDFQHFFYAADAMHHGTDPYAAGSRGYIYPPLIAFVFQPLSPIGIDRGAGVMLIVNVIVTLLAVALACDEFLKRFNAPRSQIVVTGVMLVALLVNIDKVKGEWQMWQTDVFMLLLFVLGLRIQSRFPFASGIFLGIAVNIKYLPLLFLPYLLIRKQWNVVMGLVVGTVAFALLPAVSTGWNNNARNWITATNGLLQMANIRTTPLEAAEVHDVKDSLSCSITSAFARGFGPAHGFALAAATALFTLLVAAWMYHRKGLSILQSQSAAMVGIEWVMLVAAVLAFGPQTNTRHLFDALIFTAAASAFFVSRPAHRNLPLLIGTAILFLGFVLPPGSRSFHGELTPTVKWLRMAGPCWCLLIAAMTLLWSGLDEHINSSTGR